MCQQQRSNSPVRNLCSPYARCAAGRRFGAAVIMKIAYGHEIERDDDEYIKMTENVSLAHVDAGDPGTAPVDFFPIRA